MFEGKKTKLFWCGLFVLILGIFSLVGRILGVLNGYNMYLRAINGVNQYPTLVADWSNYLLALIITTLFWSIVWIITLVVGLYIMKMGVRKEPIFTPELEVKP